MARLKSTRWIRHLGRPFSGRSSPINGFLGRVLNDQCAWNVVLVFFILLSLVYILRKDLQILNPLREASIFQKLNNKFFVGFCSVKKLVPWSKTFISLGACREMCQFHVGREDMIY